MRAVSAFHTSDGDNPRAVESHGTVWVDLDPEGDVTVFVNSAAHAQALADAFAAAASLAAR